MIGTGTPEDLAQNKNSDTGKYLAKVLGENYVEIPARKKIKISGKRRSRIDITTATG